MGPYKKAPAEQTGACDYRKKKSIGNNQVVPIVFMLFTAYQLRTLPTYQSRQVPLPQDKSV